MRFTGILLRSLAILGMVAAASGCGNAVPRTAPASLAVTVLYPTATINRRMGQDVKSLVQVLDQQGKAVTDAQVTVSIIDPSGEAIDQLSAMPGSGDIYRTATWTLPHRTQAGTWSIQVKAEAPNAQGTATTTFHVKNSIGEDLLAKYGFWADAPALKGITSDLYKEQGDAQNGLIAWGGQLPAQHIFVENWLEIHWRAGDFKLSSADQVRTFMSTMLGDDLAFAPIRAMGPFEPVKFKGWDAWQATARGQYTRYDEQWLIFYAPEADKTYAIGTMVVLPPVGIDPHATLRDGFEVHPELHANGTAPAALPPLLASPQLAGPELGTRFMGTQDPIVLSWKPLRTLNADEYYQVKLDFNYSETNTTVLYSTRETHITLPESLYKEPNCGVFNWQVTLMKQTGTDKAGQPEGTALSHSSLYWYVEWLYPAGSPMPFSPRCPNPQT